MSDFESGKTFEELDPNHIEGDLDIEKFNQEVENISAAEVEDLRAHFKILHDQEVQKRSSGSNHDLDENLFLINPENLGKFEAAIFKEYKDLYLSVVLLTGNSPIEDITDINKKREVLAQKIYSRELSPFSGFVNNHLMSTNNFFVWEDSDNPEDRQKILEEAIRFYLDNDFTFDLENLRTHILDLKTKIQNNKDLENVSVDSLTIKELALYEKYKKIVNQILILDIHSDNQERIDKILEELDTLLNKLPNFLKIDTDKTGTDFANKNFYSLLRNCMNAAYGLSNWNLETDWDEEWLENKRQENLDNIKKVNEVFLS